MTATEIYVLVFSPLCAMALVVMPLALAARDVQRSTRREQALRSKVTVAQRPSVARRYKPPVRRRTHA
ncbi:MAG: hypothetical protein ACRYF1_04645 [Janthinobacterium lividum]